MMKYFLRIVRRIERRIVPRVSVVCELATPSFGKARPTLHRFDMLGMVLTLFWICLMSLPIHQPATADEAHEIQFVEDFVLSLDREKTLESLIPGTDVYYFYQCLHLQNTQNFGAVTRILNTWRQRHGETPTYREIRNRQMLLTYSENPKRSLDYLIEQLDPQLNHQRQQLESKPKLPGSLDERLIDFDVIKKRLLRRSRDLNGFLDVALIHLRQDELTPDQRRQLLTRSRQPNHPQLIDMILGDLQYKGSRGFGSLPIHHQLTLEQLDVLSSRQPTLRNESQFVAIYLRKLQPSPDVDWTQDVEEREAYLQRLWQFAQDLSPAHNSLKASILYHWLEFDESNGRYDRTRFQAYLKLPRQGHYIEPRFLQSAAARQYRADLDWQVDECLLPPVRHDEALVRRYLLHFFRRENDYRAFAEFIQDDYLKVVFAEAKITGGLGNPEQWYALISPSQYQDLKERVDLDFAATNPRVFRTDDPVKLGLHVKNVEKLIVKIFEINTQNFYRDVGREVNTDIQLDGLIPNHEFTFEYDDSPFLRKLRTFDFPHLEKPGVYVVDFIGNGKSSRTVIRKGQLTYLSQETPQGHVFRVLNDDRQVVRQASLWMSGQMYRSDEAGNILVPYSKRPGRQPIVLSDGQLTSLQFFDHQQENYKLTLAAHIDRESLLDRKEAIVLLRPDLTVNGTPVSPSVLEDVTATVTATTLDGIQSTKQFKQLRLSESLETPLEISVPSRLASLQIELLGTITDHLERTRTYSASSQVAINQIDGTDKIEDVHLAKVGDQYLLHLLGKTGEPRPFRPLAVRLQHDAFKEPVRVQLATTEHGLVSLGALHEIRSISVETPSGTSKTWPLAGDRRTDPRSLHFRAGEPVQIPHMLNKQETEKAGISLYELRGDSLARDLSELVETEPHFLEIKNLGAGDYRLLIGQQSTLLRVTEGTEEAGYAVGELRRLELRKLAPLQIVNVSHNASQLEIRLANRSDFSRIHVFATRFVPAFDPFDALGQIVEPEPLAIRAPAAQSYYMAGRRLGDELKYVLERAYAQKFPGNLLERPSLLLNTWAIHDTQTSTQTAADGEAFDAAAAAPEAAANKMSKRQRKQEQIPTDFANLDFLARTTALLANLKPDEEGRITIPLEKLGSNQHLHIVAVDPITTVYRSHTLSSVEDQLRDLRLTQGLDPDKHFTQQKATTIVAAGDTFELADITTSKFDQYDSLRRVYQLFTTVSSDAHLRTFAFVVDWPNLSSEEKQDKYSEFACHELNFFLFKKDPDFFAEVVRPYLENKYHKTFLDEWLLDRDLHGYLQPWYFARLNTVERLLLAERLPSQADSVRRLLANQLDVVPVDVDHLDFLFSSTIAGQALERSEELGSQLKLLEQRKLSELGQENQRGLTRRYAVQDRSLAVEEKAVMDAETEGLRRQSASRYADDGAVPFFGMQPMAGGRAFRRSRGRALFEQLDKTKEWAELNYYQIPIAQHTAQRVPPSPFWRDFANRDTEQPFLSVRWPEASRNFTEMMFTLSVLDLPFQAEEPETNFDDARMTLTAKSPLVIFHQQIRETNVANEESPVLITQNYFRADDRYEMVQGQRQDKFVTDEFLTHVVYGCQIVLTNPTSTPRQVEVLQQIPHMAIATSGGQATKMVKLKLEPFHTQTLDYHFYFPEEGDFGHFPAHVSEGESLLGNALSTTLHVVEKHSRVDEASWDYVSQFASNEDVIEYLDQHRLIDLDLTKIAFRMAKKSFFEAAIGRLRDRHVYSHELWAYGLKHNHPETIGTYLRHSDGFVHRCGATLDCDLLQIDPVDRTTYQHLDYKPLVNARAHQLGDRRQILNDRFHAQYHRLLGVLKYRAELTPEDRLSLTYYLLLQDRIEEALAMFAKVERSSLDATMQYDYFAAYLDCFQPDPVNARQIVQQYVNYPVEKWQLAFASVKTVLDELDGKAMAAIDPQDRTQTQTAAASEQPSFEFVMDGPQMELTYQNVDEVRVRYYLVDLELLFSRNPFVQQFDGKFSHIQPNQTQVVSVPSERSQFQLDLPEALHNRNVLVEIEAEGITRSQLYSSNSITVQLSENYGQLKVVETQSTRSLPQTYVKVYAELNNGQVAFYKDGYTDIRGRFDYASLSTNQLDHVKRFSILILDPARGGLVREAKPPKR